jgi:hypothetical protein
MTFGDGHIYVIVLTASWCHPCQEVYGAFAPLERRFAPDRVRFVYATPLFGFYGKQTDLSPAEEMDSLQTYFLAKHHVTARVAIASQHDFMSTYFPDGRFSFPRFLVIDGAGTVRAVYPQWTPQVPQLLADQLAALVRALVRVPGDTTGRSSGGGSSKQ